MSASTFYGLKGERATWGQAYKLIGDG